MALLKQKFCGTETPTHRVSKPLRRSLSNPGTDEITSKPLSACELHLICSCRLLHTSIEHGAKIPMFVLILRHLMTWKGETRWCSRAIEPNARVTRF